MSGIRGKDTKPEILVRKALHSLGFRYRLHDRNLPGTPDIVFPRHGAVIFVHGCFWHGHSCRFFKLPATRSEFWAHKIGRNRANDDAHVRALAELGWRVATVWECALRGRGIDTDAAIDRLASWLVEGEANIDVIG